MIRVELRDRNGIVLAIMPFAAVPQPQDHIILMRESVAIGHAGRWLVKRTTWVPTGDLTEYSPL